MIHIIVGPTASHKTEAANTIASFLNAPIINADAYQIYKDMNIGTNKISNSDPNYNRYHLLDVISPNESCNVVLYQKLFRETVSELNKTYKDIVVVGGNGLYLRAAIYDYEFKEEEPADLSKYEHLSNEELYRLLGEIDAISLKSIHVNNRKRIIRALEIYEKNKVSKSEIIASQSHTLIYPKDEVKIYFISPDRKELYESINNRVDIMFDQGLVEEVKSLKEKYQLSNTAKAAIGYKEVLSYLDKELTLEECKELIKKNTRNYAKRQITFFKHQFQTTVFPSYKQVIDEVVR